MEFSVPEIFPIMFPEEPVNKIFPVVRSSEIVTPFASFCDSWHSITAVYIDRYGSSVGGKDSQSEKSSNVT